MKTSKLCEQLDAIESEYRGLVAEHKARVDRLVEIGNQARDLLNTDEWSDHGKADYDLRTYGKQDLSWRHDAIQKLDRLFLDWKIERGFCRP